ncbi:MAG TPA: Lrp/AsnC family transcriptional regulator [Chloroflexota bacterium]|nr:Lrp/AsnC family transcriptional regulator [Chloroflexota bacterium]
MPADSPPPPPDHLGRRGRREPVGSTDERVHALLARDGRLTLAQIGEALALGHVSATLSLERLEGAGAVRRLSVPSGAADVWEVIPAS